MEYFYNRDMKYKAPLEHPAKKLFWGANTMEQQYLPKRTYFGIEIAIYSIIRMMIN